MTCIYSSESIYLVLYLNYNSNDFTHLNYNSNDSTHYLRARRDTIVNARFIFAGAQFFGCNLKKKINVKEKKLLGKRKIITIPPLVSIGLNDIETNRHDPQYCVT